MSRDYEKQRAMRAHRMCWRKNQYASREAAKGAIDLAWTERGIELRTYQCPVCAKFHLTKGPRDLD